MTYYTQLHTGGFQKYTFRGWRKWESYTGLNLISVTSRSINPPLVCPYPTSGLYMNIFPL